MRGKKEQNKLEKAGWRVGSAADFLSLTEAESACIEMKRALARRSRRLTQQKLAT